MNKKSSEFKKGITLLELLLVMGIIAIVGAAVVFVINPIDSFKQSRDVRRVQEIQTIDSALSLYKNDVGAFLKSSSTVFISLPDNNINCSSYILPALPGGWVYQCVAQANLQKTDGTGWVPVDFQKISSNNSPALPIDPANSSQNGLYYTFVTSGPKWEISAKLESLKNTGASGVAGKDGGTNSNILEAGTNLNLTPPQVENR